MPVSVSRLKKPLVQVAPPGAQSLMLEFVLALASVSACRPTIAPVALNALNGTDTSIEDTAPFAQTTTLHVCCALPTVTKVPNGRSTWTVGTPDESNRIHALASGVPSRFASTVIEKPSL